MTSAHEWRANKEFFRNHNECGHPEGILHYGRKVGLQQDFCKIELSKKWETSALRSHMNPLHDKQLPLRMKPSRDP